MNEWLVSVVVIFGGGFLWWVWRRNSSQRYPLLEIGIENRSCLIEKIRGESNNFDFAEKILEKDSKSGADIVDLVLDVLDEKALAFAQKLLRDEIRTSVMEGVVFRSNTNCSRVLSTYAVRTGSKYLQEVMGLHVQKIVTESLDMEVFPARLENLAVLDRNRERVTVTFQIIFSAIVSSVETIPYPIRVLSHCLWEEAMLKFPQSAGIYVGSFFFSPIYLCWNNDSTKLRNCQ